MPDSHLAPGITGRINYVCWIHEILHQHPDFQDCTTEKDVGIEKSGLDWVLIRRYVSNVPGIRCVLKNSCDDFIVREIDKDGNVVDLVSEELPPGSELALLVLTSRRSG